MTEKSNMGQNESFHRVFKAGIWKELHAREILTDGQLEWLLNRLEHDNMGLGRQSAVCKPPNREAEL